MSLQAVGHQNLTSVRYLVASKVLEVVGNQSETVSNLAKSSLRLTLVDKMLKKSKMHTESLHNVQVLNWNSN